MSDVLNATVLAGVPLLLAALGGVIAQRSGVLNIALEGLMLIGAFVAAWAAATLGSEQAGFWFALLFGAAFGLLLGWITVGLRGDQVVVGIAFNILALGATSYLF
ncbi:MAG: ABC transporter permease, partial [bacterium]|nr:ABC transporter permease [bacterium]